jgi:hypothetical protein
LGHRVTHAWRAAGIHFRGEDYGLTGIPSDGEIDGDQLVISLVGYMAEKRTDWPPPWSQAREEELELVGAHVRVHGLDETGYERIVARTRLDARCKATRIQIPKPRSTRCSASSLTPQRPRSTRSRAPSRR